MEMINFDNYNEKQSKHHFIMPDCHFMMVGQTGCGKINTLTNMLLQSWLKSERITIYTINPDQEKYQLLEDFNGEICSSLENVIPVEELDSSEDSKITSFDDIKDRII